MKVFIDIIRPGNTVELVIVVAFSYASCLIAWRIDVILGLVLLLLT